SSLDEHVACLVVQQPNFFGGIEPMAELAANAHKHGALFVAVVEPTSLAILEAPRAYAADIVAAEGQPLGIPLSFGGPYVGLMAARMDSVRQMPGRLVGATRDAAGRRGYVLTLQAREQHIRREKAASNICTNQALCALAATAYLSAVGPEGLREVAELSMVQTRHAVSALEAAGVGQPRFSAPYFAEAAVRIPDAKRRHAALADQGILAGFPLEDAYPALRNCLLVAATELTTDDDVARLVGGDELRVLQPLIFASSRPGRRDVRFPKPSEAAQAAAASQPELPAEALRTAAARLPEVSELDLLRHFNRLSHLNHAIDLGFYPLGSCTMKYNPKVNEWAARLPGLSESHP